jgi:hypothetical protein
MYTLQGEKQTVYALNKYQAKPWANVKNAGGDKSM